MIIADQLSLVVVSIVRYKNKKYLLLCNTKYHRKQNNLLRRLPENAHKNQCLKASDQTNTT
jgi:hypothetical protein